VLQIFQYHIFPRLERVTVRRSEKFGGDRSFASYSDMEQAYRNGEVHPLDLKKTCGDCLIEILGPVRDYIR
jgi:tyrosyl-tRNA synthetase